MNTISTDRSNYAVQRICGKYWDAVMFTYFYMRQILPLCVRWHFRSRIFQANNTVYQLIFEGTFSYIQMYRRNSFPVIKRQNTKKSIIFGFGKVWLTLQQFSSQIFNLESLWNQFNISNWQNWILSFFLSSQNDDKSIFSS